MQTFVPTEEEAKALLSAKYCSPLKLQDIACVWISPPLEKYKKRQEHMHRLCQTIGFKKVTARKGYTDYPRCLARSNRDILFENLQTNPDDPLLILEDDVDWNGQEFFSVPHGTDAIWLGSSTCRASRVKNHHVVKAELADWNAGWVRVINMLSTHAVLYLSRRFKEMALQQFEADLLAPDPTHIDILLGRQQSKFQVLAPRGLPVFVQSALFNSKHAHEATLQVLEPTM